MSSTLPDDVLRRARRPSRFDPGLAGRKREGWEPSWKIRPRIYPKTITNDLVVSFFNQIENLVQSLKVHKS
jgi:hypothetical protein